MQDFIFIFWENIYFPKLILWFPIFIFLICIIMFFWFFLNLKRIVFLLYFSYSVLLGFSKFCFLYKGLIIAFGKWDMDEYKLNILGVSP
jgi:hypothetical protein